MMAILAACLTARHEKSEWKEQKWSVFENEERVEHEHTRPLILTTSAHRLPTKPTRNRSQPMP
jgi:hypothetical protein